MEWNRKRITLDRPTKRNQQVVDSKIRMVKQDKLGRVYIWTE